ncbi:peptidoglycan endopeptidase [Altericroceibacterium spongiae]|uniref:Peptidoglycan endopeptidase n=1 Tax=Altericroceibacterium spongiae TaxID=2320269 RepID=A0A420EIT6_9SPHN|nr:NlpC/P60 family protein [Altericroceibacterium spongiae]RKF20574.1 peptidoglycan endopeptidase [Altericroceibacterium spongiae]
MSTQTQTQAQAQALVEAARTYIGTPFRLHGRDRQHGLDCLGLILAALRDTGHRCPSPPPYALRNSRIDPLLAFAANSGLIQGPPPFRTGDILLGKVGPAQWHAAIAMGPTGFIHAHAGLRRVVQTPGAFPWPLLGLWRCPSN